jgi:hypothetical protein
MLSCWFIHAAGVWGTIGYEGRFGKDRAGLERTLEKKDYVQQVARYVAASERFLGERPRPILCLLNYAGRLRLVENR